MCVNPEGKRGKTGDLSREVLQTAGAAVTTNCKKSAEAIVGVIRRADKVTGTSCFEVALNRRMPNGMYGGVRGGRDSLLLDYIKAPLSKESGIS